MDHAGAAVGSLAAMALVAVGLRVEQVFFVAAVPGLLAVAALLLVLLLPRARPPALADSALE